MKRIFFVLLGAILSTGCALSSFTPTPALPPTVDTLNTLPEPTDDTQVFTVRSGDLFNLVVPSNSSTGYHWEIIPELDVNVVAFMDQLYIPEEPVMPGSGGMDVWTFRAVNTGDTTLALGYYPPGNDTDPEETVTFSIRVM